MLLVPLEGGCADTGIRIAVDNDDAGNAALSHTIQSLGIIAVSISTPKCQTRSLFRSDRQNHCDCPL